MTSSLYCIMNTLRTNHRVGKLNSQNLYPPHIGLNQYHIQLCQENVLPTSKSNTFVWNIVKMYFTALVVNLFLESAIPWGMWSVFAITLCFETNRLAIGNYSDPMSSRQMNFISIFLHERGKFMYFEEVKTMPNNFQITAMLKYECTHTHTHIYTWRH